MHPLLFGPLIVVVAHPVFIYCHRFHLPFDDGRPSSSMVFCFQHAALGNLLDKVINSPACMLHCALLHTALSIVAAAEPWDCCKY